MEKNPDLSPAPGSSKSETLAPLREREALLIKQRSELRKSLAAATSELAEVRAKLVAATVETQHDEYRVVRASDTIPALPFLYAVFAEGVPRIITHAFHDVGDALLEPYVEGTAFDKSRSSTRLAKGARGLMKEAVSGTRILLTGERRPLAILGPMTAEAGDFIRQWRARRD